MMSIIQSKHLPESPQPQPAVSGRWQWLRPTRSLIIAVVTMIALLSATVAIGQSSQDFDLACRSITASGGTVSTGGDFAVIGALGIPFAPPKNSDTNPTYAIRSTDYGVRGGFLPGYPNKRSAAVAHAATVPTSSEQSTIQRLPLILNIQAIIRGGC